MDDCNGSAEGEREGVHRDRLGVWGASAEAAEEPGEELLCICEEAAGGLDEDDGRGVG